MLRYEQVSFSFGEDQFIAWGNQVRLDEVIVMLHSMFISPVAPGRPARAIGSNCIIRTRVGPESVSRADGDGRRLVARRMNLTVNFLSTLCLSVVTSRGQANYSGIDQPAHGTAN